MNESNYCFMTNIFLTFIFITNEIIRSELYILNLFEGHCGVNFSNFIFQRLENAQIEKWIFFPFCFGILFLWTLFWAIIPKYRKITLLSGRQSPRDPEMGRGSKLSPCHRSVTATKVCLYHTVYTLACVQYSHYGTSHFGKRSSCASHFCTFSLACHKNMLPTVSWNK